MSHAIRSLEEGFGEQLFARTGRTVTLTHEGANLAKRARASLGLLTDALERLPGLDDRVSARSKRCTRRSTSSFEALRPLLRLLPVKLMS